MKNASIVTNIFIVFPYWYVLINNTLSKIEYEIKTFNTSDIDVEGAFSLELIIFSRYTYI